MACMAANQMAREGNAVNVTSFEQLETGSTSAKSMSSFTGDSRTIKAALRRAPNRKFNPDVKFSELVYCALFTKKFISESEGNIQIYA